MDKWISVEAKTPDESGYYNVVIVGDSGNPSVHSFWWNGEHWCFDNEACEGEPLFTAGYGIDVTHWQPLPSPPKQ